MSTGLSHVLSTKSPKNIILLNILDFSPDFCIWALNQSLNNMSICKAISDIDPHFFRDPSLSISDRSQIGQTGTTHSLLCVTVLQYSHMWRELIYSWSWDYKTSFYNYNTNNRLILARQVGWDMRSSCFYQVISKQCLAIRETMTDQIVWKV